MEFVHNCLLGLEARVAHLEQFELEFQHRFWLRGQKWLLGFGERNGQHGAQLECRLEGHASILFKLVSGLRVSIINSDYVRLASLHLLLQEGILYLTQGGSDTVTILKPDDREFGLQLDAVGLAAEGSSQSGHIFPADLLYLNERWWVIMQSRDGSTAGLYQFTPRWQFDRALDLPPGALPTALTHWANKVLVTDSAQQLVYRFDAAAKQAPRMNPPRALESGAIQTNSQ